MRVRIETDDNVIYDLKTDFGWLCDLPDDISIPAVRTNYIEIPGRNGELDLTEIDGNLYYEDVDFTLQLQKICRTSQQVFDAVRQIANLFSGQRVKIFLNEDTYYYDARVDVNDFSKEGLKLVCDINVKAFPFRLQNEPTNVEVQLSSTEQTITLENGTMQVVPTISSTDGATITYGTATYSVSAGSGLTIPSFVLQQGNNEVRVSGTGTLTFTYTRGEF